MKNFMVGVVAAMSIFSSSASLAQAEKFWWGIATSAYQTEDVADGFKTDWDLFYEAGKLKEPKGHGTYSYSMVERDIEALKKLGVTHYRFNIEWARVEPRPGEFDEMAIDHYLYIARRLIEEGIVPVLTFWHFTFPEWATDLKHPERHGWNHPLTIARWTPYIEKMMTRFGPLIKYYAPQNEVNATALGGYIIGLFPPGKRLKFDMYLSQMSSAAFCFKDAAQIIKRVRPDAVVMTIQNYVYWERSVFDVFGGLAARGEEYNLYYLDMVAPFTDWIGFNYYFRFKFTVFSDQRKIDPSGMALAIDRLWGRYHKPLIIMENGVADSDDSKRIPYIVDHVREVDRGIARGVPIKGYFYWSLIDNFEWPEGYKTKFGLFSVDEKTWQLVPKRSAEFYRAFIKKRVAEAKP
jgi:beta-glucosidase